MAEETEKLHIARECASDPDAPPPTCIISEDICEAAGIHLACDSVTCMNAPDDTALAECRALGGALA